MADIDTSIDTRILRDMNDGALVLDITGTILYINRQALSLLELQTNPTGKKYAAVFLDTDQQNDAFHQMILDAVYHKEWPQTKVVAWCTEKQKQLFRLTSSFLQTEDGSKNIGVVVLFSDVTEVETLNRQQRESSVIFAATLCTDILITLAGAALLVGGTLLLLRVAPGFFPADAPFWDWSIGNVSDLYYPVTVVFQEFLAQGVMLGSLQRIFTGKHGRRLSLLISAILFGVMHIAYGLPYMIGAILMLDALGLLYNKQGHIWGLCIIHYVLGTMAIFLRYVV